MWQRRLIAGAVVLALAGVGSAFLLASAYMALQQVVAPSVAALIVGAALLLMAGTVVLIVALMRPRQAGAAARSESAADQLVAIGEAPSAEATALQIGLLLRQMNPVTLALFGAGLLFGLLRRR